ncbi:sigma-70 family RNA polymerase sigma factor [Pseudomonas sp. NPDC007930]|uniref:sigma-70 family RNA polymerase sigma factor n=1 Tax=Pseudomonas sp. NPDC007930 TaxID=3364417 RepID=UPI0036E2C71A
MPSSPPPAHAALGALYRTHHSWLRGWLRQRLGNPCDAADLAQDTFVKILKAHCVEQIEQPRRYLSVVAKGLMVDLFRRRSLEHAYLDTLAQLPGDQQPCLEQQAILLETLHAVDAMLAGLGAKVRLAFLLSQLDGLTYPQIAEQLGISVRSVNNYVAKAMAHCCLMQWAETP